MFNKHFLSPYQGPGPGYAQCSGFKKARHSLAFWARIGSAAVPSPDLNGFAQQKSVSLVTCPVQVGKGAFASHSLSLPSWRDTIWGTWPPGLRGRGEKLDTRWFLSASRLRPVTSTHFPICQNSSRQLNSFAGGCLGSTTYYSCRTEPNYRD